MLQASALCLLAWLVPTGILLRLRRRSTRADFWLALSLVIGFQALAAGFLHERLAYGWAKFLLVVALSVPLTWPFLRGVANEETVPTKLWRRGMLCLAAFLLFENLWVLGSQGWDPLFGSAAYFRPPFNNDGQRHVILVEALLRGTAAPFVPGLTLTYQVLWHHFVAVLAALFPGPSHYPVIQGALLSTGLVGALAIVWSLTELSPRAFLRPVGWIVALVALLHADLFHMARMWIATGHWGLEADWSATTSFFRYFSMNLVWLTAPQHQLFFLWLVVFLAFFRKDAGAKFWSAKVLFLFTFCWISSSLMAMFFFPFYFVGLWRQFWKRPTQLLSALGGVALAAILHWLALGFSVVKLFTREGNGKPAFLWVTDGAWQVLPITGIATSGVVGLAALLLLFWEIRHWKRSRIFGWEWMVFGVGALLLTYGITMPEFRRHFAMLATFAAGYWVIDRLPALYESLPRRTGIAVGGGLLALAAALHGYFLYSYVGKPSYIDPKIPWHDYLTLNEILRTQYPGIPTLAAVDKDRGLDYPPVMEATTSFSAPYHAAVHVQLEPRHQDIMGRMFVTKQFMPYGLELGYQAVVWGPFEDLIWGPKVKARFIDETFRLARAGTVGLYRIHDSWSEEIQRARAEGGPSVLAMARKLKENEFRGEAIDLYQASLYYNPQQVDVWLELAATVDPLSQWAWKQEILQRAIEANPRYPVTYFELGVLLRGLDDPRGAVHAFRQAIALSPKYGPAYRELAATLAFFGNAEEAGRVLDRAEKAGVTDPTIQKMRAQLELQSRGAE